MPWHWVQFLRMTCHTGPSGRSTFGRVAPRFCAATGATRDAVNAAITTSRAGPTAALPNLNFIGDFSIIAGGGNSGTETEFLVLQKFGFRPRIT